jgi:hypothetical protein
LTDSEIYYILWKLVFGKADDYAHDITNEISFWALGAVILPPEITWALPWSYSGVYGNRWD